MTDESAPLRQQSPADAEPVSIDLGAHATRTVALGGAVSGAVGLLALVAAFTGQVIGGTGATVAAGVIGGIFLLFALVVLFSWRTLSRPRRLIFDAGGIRMDDPHGRPWSVAWDELSGVAISRTVQRRVKPADYVVRRVLVRLDMFPADPGFRTRHPEMEHLWELHRVRDGYRLPFGSAPELLPRIDEAIRRHRSDIYRGVRDEGFTVGLQ